MSVFVIRALPFGIRIGAPELAGNSHIDRVLIKGPGLGLCLEPGTPSWEWDVDSMVLAEGSRFMNPPKDFWKTS